MKRILQFTLGIFACSLISMQAIGQSGQYGNEWINYNSTYYKFKVAKSGIFRISLASLNAAGVPSTVAGSNFKLYRDGLEVPVYVSAEAMSATDYIEFAGRGAEGILDKELYLTPSWQLNPHISLFTDTAAYFLTYDNAAGHSRYTHATNAIPATPPAPEAYNWATAGNYYKNSLIQGPSFDVTLGINYTPPSPNPGNPFFSPSFQNGEGLVAGQVGLGSAFSLVLNTPNIAGVAVASVLTTSMANRTYHATSNVNISVNNSLAANATWGVSETKNITANVPSGTLNSASTTISYNPLSGGLSSYDIYGVAFAELKYPRNYDVAGLNYFSFKLNAAGSNQYLEFSNVAGTARLYDLTNSKWYAGDVAAGKTRFYLQPSALERDLVLVTDGTATVIAPIKNIQFTNYTQSANQGDYIIVTHNQLMQPVGGVNYIDQYKQYRASVNGGLHKVVVADVTELYDQFAYGYETHPLSIRHFLKYAYDSWTATRPVAVNIIGRGLQYEEYPEYYSKPATYTFPIVPVYGSPGSDVDFVNFGLGADRTQKLQIGRVSVWNGTEVAKYLNKIQAYEAAIKTNAFPTAATELWKKNVMHIAGAQNNSELINTLAPTLEAGKRIIEDTLLGAKVFSVYSDNVSVNQVDRQLVDSLFSSGLNIITYLGHASSSTFFYNLPSPSSFNSVPKVPVFVALGCDVAQMFGAVTTKTLSEDYTLSPTGGSIAMLATDNYGYTDFLHNYLVTFYNSLSFQNYGGTLGLHMMSTHNQLYTLGGCDNMGAEGNSYFTQIESQLLTGDPGIPMFAPAKPDFHVSAEGISSFPANVSTSIDSFQLRIVGYNLGRVIKDTVQVKIEHRTPGGTLDVTKTYNIYNLLNSDTTYVWMPVNPTTDLGLNKYTVKIDAPDKYSELNEQNNTADLDLFIYSDNLIPVYPYEFSIVHEQGVTLKASTLNPFRPTARYVLEIDTTTNFNSPLKLQTTVNSRGGVIKWKPSISMRDSTVYYWRAAFDSVVRGAVQWTGSSFIYLAQGSDGWNQSHYFQYQQDGYNNMTLPANRIFTYIFKPNTLKIISGVIGGADDNRILWNDGVLNRAGQSNAGILQIMVIDSVSGETWKNKRSPNQLPYSNPISDNTKGYHLIEFYSYSREGRFAAKHYLDSIPNGNYVMIRNSFFMGSSAYIFVNDWKADTIASPGNSLYNTVKALGFNDIDSFTKPMIFTYLFKKGRPATEFAPQQALTLPGIQDTILATIKSRDNYGDLHSTIVGPAKEWQQLKWKMHPSDTLARNDTANIYIYGITAAGNETFLYEGPARDTSLSFIKAATYPKIRMEWRTKDSLSVTAPQLNYWRVLYSPVPEAALNPALNFAFADSLQIGQQQTITVAVENLTPIAMDSMLVSYKAINANGVTSNIPGSPKRYRKLPGNDTLNATFSFDPKAYPGANNLFVEVNPNNDQPEQYHPNNLGYLPFNIAVDNRNPLLDVTFDGVHILNNDIVSAKPLIKILLKDENTFLALNDTSLISLSITGQKHPTVELPFDGITCKFIPGQTGTSGKNEASVEISKTFEDDIYELAVTGKDRSNNSAGTTAGTSTQASYKIAYEVINKPTVTNVLNYPNPFSTATSFLFTITGSQIPSQFKIQILSVTGKVVREITKGELGPLHIGRNMTEYKWDGRDQYGQLLGNGVYMYRVATSLNGESIEHRDGGGDRFFKNGFGKMYIMR